MRLKTNLYLELILREMILSELEDERISTNLIEKSNGEETECSYKELNDERNSNEFNCRIK